MRLKKNNINITIAEHEHLASVEDDVIIERYQEYNMYDEEQYVRDEEE